MLRYALATLRARTSGFVGAFLALFCAAALVTACGSLLETGLRGPILTERYAATPIVVTADQNVHHETRKNDKTKHKAKPVYERVWLPADTAERLTDLPGADAVITELTFPATPLDERGHPFGGPEALGHAWSSAPLTPFTLTDGTAPGQPGEIVLDRALADRAGLSVGDTVTVQSTGDPAAHTVTGIADGALTEQAAVFFSDEEARGLAGHDGRITMAGLFPADGTTTAELADRARAALDGTSAVVRTGDDRGQSEFPGAEQARVQLVSMGGAVGGTGLIVAVLVVVGTFGLTAHARAREFALLRAVAATPRQIRRLIGREALLVALAAGPLGALAGLPLSGWLYDRLTGLGTVPETVGQVHSLFPMAAAVLATLPTAWLAARISARRPARVRPAQALTEAAAEPRRTPLPRLIAGFAALAGGVVLLFVLTVLHIEPASTPVTYLTVLLLSIAVALLGPTLCRVAFTLIGAPLRWCGVPGHLAAHNARAGARRLASVITPLTLLVAMACTVLFTQTTLTAAAERQARDGVVADRVVAAAGPGVPHAAVETLRDTDGVTAVTEVTHSTVRTPGLDKYSVQGVTTGPGLDATLDLGVTEGSLADLGEGGVAVSDVISDSKDLHPGDTLALVLGDGTPVETTVAAVYDRALGFGDLTLPYDLLSAHVDNPLADTVLVATTLSDGELTAALAGHPGLSVKGSGHVADALAEQRQNGAQVAFLAMGLVLAFTTIAAVNTLAMATADRRREFALLRKVGTTRRQVLRMLRLESLTVAITAVLIGSAISLAVLTGFSAGMTGEAAPAPAAVPYLLVAAGVTALALIATSLPGRFSLRTAG